MDREYTEAYSRLEDQHWWFTARRRVLKALLRRFVPWHEEMSVLEVGAGSGRNLYELYPSGVDLCGLEPDEGSVEIARTRGDIPMFTGTLEALPQPIATRSFDLITMFDVLEHIRDDAEALRRLSERLTPRGQLVLSVPAYNWMWGRQDEVSHHFRRYTLRGLIELLECQGYEVRWSTYFNSVLFIPIASIRLASRIVPASGKSDFDFPTGLVNRLLHSLFSLEAHYLAFGRFPVGVSAFVVARKKSA